MRYRGAIVATEPLPDSEFILVETKACTVCGKRHRFTLNREAFDAWQDHEYIQNAFPNMSAGDREILISGTCDKCFHELFPPEE